MEEATRGSPAAAAAAAAAAAFPLQGFAFRALV